MATRRQRKPANIRLTLIVGTRNRSEALRRLFCSLKQQTVTDFEVVVVDQSDDRLRLRTRDLVREVSGALCIRYIRDAGLGLSRARNMALRVARGRYVGFPDDDCWYDAGVVEHVESFFGEASSCGILSGCYGEPGRHNDAFPRAPANLTIWNVFNRGSSVGTFINLGVVRTEDIVFDEYLGAGTSLPVAEETDVLLRLLSKKVPGYYDPQLKIFHRVGEGKIRNREQFVAFRNAFWYVIGKNYRPLFSELKVISGLGSCMLRSAPYGIRANLQPLVWGLTKGLQTRFRVQSS